MSEQDDRGGDLVNECNEEYVESVCEDERRSKGRLIRSLEEREGGRRDGGKWNAEMVKRERRESESKTALNRIQTRRRMKRRYGLWASGVRNTVRGGRYMEVGGRKRR